MNPIGRFFAAAALAAAVPVAHAALPVVQRGEWILKSKVDGRPHEARLCGNPLDRVAAAIAAAHEAGKLGCRVSIEQPQPRTVNVSVDCPADRVSADGAHRVRKGSVWLGINAASMRSVWIDLRRDGRHESIHAERTGECSR